MIHYLKTLCGFKPGSFVAFAGTHKNTRQENQDNYLIIQKESNQPIARLLEDEKEITRPVPDWPDSMIRLAVADGMGGHENGRQIAEKLMMALTQLPPQYKPEDIKHHLMTIHLQLYDTFSKHSDRSPGTTLVMLDIHKQTGKAVAIHVGDSRAYLIKPRQFNKLPTIRQLTKDHSFAEFAYRDGELDQKTYIHHLNSQEIRLAQAVGFGSRGILFDEEGFKPFRPDKGLRIDLKNDLPKPFRTHADAFELTIKPNHVLMISSDGLWSGEHTGQWSNDHLFKHISQDVVTQLINIALNRNTNDNITLIIAGFQTKTFRPMHKS